jgi:uncharacterized membrane protein YkvA (DUF1232 family)
MTHERDFGHTLMPYVLSRYFLLHPEGGGLMAGPRCIAYLEDDLQRGGMVCAIHAPPQESPRSEDPSKEFSEESLWDKLARFARVAGEEVVEKVLWLYFVLLKPETPVWVRGTIVGALAYFIWPADAIPDVLPVAGYTDDLGVLTAAVGYLAMYIDEDVKARARRKMEDWFGPVQTGPSLHFSRDEAAAKLGRQVRVVAPFQKVDVGMIGYVERIHAVDDWWAVGIRWDRSGQTDLPEGLVTKAEYERFLEEEPAR